MGVDPNLELKVLEALRIPVSPAESQRRRVRILLKGLGAVLVLAFAFIIKHDPGGTGWRHPLVLAAVLGVPGLVGLRSFVVEYRVARSRPATPVPSDVLTWELKGSCLCPRCGMLVRGLAERCPGCNQMTPRAVGETRVAVGVLIIIVGLLVVGFYRIMVSP